MSIAETFQASPPPLATQATAELKPPSLSRPLPTLSIIVPVYNSLPKVIECLNHLSVTIDWTRTEVLCQDDASPDYDLRRLIHAPFKVERNEENLGFIRNVNRAAKRAHGDYLCLFNQDVRALKPGWADDMLALFADKRVGIVGPKLVFPQGGIQSCGG